MVLSDIEKYQRNLEAQKRWREKNPNYQKIWHQRNPEKSKKYGRDFYYRNWEKRKLESKMRRRRLYSKNPIPIIERQRKFRWKTKIEILFSYGGNPPKCACCGEQELGFLTIDHINGDGAKQRREATLGRGGHIFYLWLKRNNYPEGFQVLCYNCNCGRARNNGICPHKKSMVGKYEI